MRTTLILLFGLLTSICLPQTATDINSVHNVYDEKGDYYFDKKEFKKAIVYYNMAYKLDVNNYYSVLRKAETFAAMELYDQAAECYQILFDTKLYIPNEHRLKFALLLLKNKDIIGYNGWMKKYNEIVYSEIHGYLNSTDVRAKMYKDTSYVIIENESVLNTPESEICPVIHDDKVLFASTRKNLAGSGANNYYNMFSANYLEGGQLGKLNLFNKSINSAQNESSITFSDNTKNLYFTRSASTNLKLKTYVTKIPVNSSEKLDVKELLIEGITSIGHVSFNSNGTKMYFVSEALGGSGGLDICSSEFTGGKWSKPVNLGPTINSGKDEMYPYILNDTILYFSSAGHNTLGGFDLYSVNLKQEKSSPKNLGSNVNSKYDDYALSFSPGGLTGYFCSNRPGGFGKEDIYRVHLLDIKVKLPAYKFKKKYSIESDKINLYLSSGDEHNIMSKDKAGFDFGFLPVESYKMVIQHENPLVSNIIYNNKLTEGQKRKELLTPSPIKRTEIRLQAGMKYKFTAGMKPIGNDYKKALEELSKDYQNSTNTIDLTALAKELYLEEGEIYTIRFEKDESQTQVGKVAGESTLFINDQTISVSGSSFFIVLPLDIQANFNIQTDIAHFKETFSPKKVGAVKVDAGAVYKKEEAVKLSEGFPILVNTESLSDVASGKKISATELTIIPGSMYILTFTRTGASPEDLGVTIPLTKGVKYNLGTENQSQNDYNQALSQMAAVKGANPNEELIDISVLSKELDILSEKDIIFSLTPAKQFALQTSGVGNVLTTLAVNGRKYYITSVQKLQVNLKLDQNKKMNIQTDLAYVKENFESSTIALKVDTTSFKATLNEKKKSVITDPVFDVITINFNLNDYSIRPDAKSIVADKVIQVLKGDTKLYVTIKGYTDPLGDAEYNLKLSKNRAQAVKDFLINNGIGESRIRTFSYGASLALKSGEKWESLSEEELQKHRKVEIVIYLPK